MILMLLFSSKNLVAQNNEVSPLRARQFDSTLVSVEIGYIKQANAKLIERQYLIDINQELEDIRIYQNAYIDTLNVINQINRNEIIKQSIDIHNLEENIKKEKTKVNIYKGATIASIIITILTLIIN